MKSIRGCADAPPEWTLPSAPSEPPLLVVDYMGGADRQRGRAPAWEADGWARWRWDANGVHDGFVLHTNAAPCAAFRLFAVVRQPVSL